MQMQTSQKHKITVDMHHLNSAAICCVGYSREQEQMFVKFNASSLIYAYDGVTSSMWQSFRAATSPGGWVAANLVGQGTTHTVTRFGLSYNKTGWQFNFVRPATPKFSLHLS